MKTELSKKTQSEINEFLKTISTEVELRNTKPINGVFLIKVLGRKFEYIEDLRAIVNKINEGEKHIIIRFCEEAGFNRGIYTDKITGEKIDELEEAKRLLESDIESIDFSDKQYFYFLVEDLERLKEIKKGTNTKLKISVNKKIIETSTEPILNEAGSLNLRRDGSICFENKVIDIRLGIRPLCELFIRRPNQLINRDDIKDELNLRSKHKKSTIAKYVNELNVALEKDFDRKPIINYKKEGWMFHP